MDFKICISGKIQIYFGQSFPRLRDATALNQENVCLLNHVHHLPCCTDTHGCSRTGVRLEFLAYFLWKTVSESSAALGLNTSGVVSLLWWLLKTIESEGNNSCLLLALGLGFWCWMFWERLTQCTPVLHSEEAQRHMWRLLCTSSMKLLVFVVLLRLQSSTECNFIQKGKVSNPGKYLQSHVIWGWVTFLKKGRMPKAGSPLCTYHHYFMTVKYMLCWKGDWKMFKYKTGRRRYY